MAVVYMSGATIKAGDGTTTIKGDAAGRHAYQTISTSGNTDTVIMDTVQPGESFNVAIMVPSSGTGKVQFTFDDIASIRGETANWEDWSAGSVTATTSSYFPAAVMAVRGVVSAGTIKFVVSR